MMIGFLAVIIGPGFTTTYGQKVMPAGDPLNLWNEGPTKASIKTFIKTATDKNNAHFIPVRDRVAVFDMDGTILLEKPSFVLFDFVMRRLTDQIARNPELKKKQPYKAVYEKDWDYFEKLPLYGDDGLYSVLLYAGDGCTDDQFRNAVREYLRTVIDKRYNKPYNELVFAPMVQLIRYLQENKFEVYIVSGSDPEFTRTFCEAAANIPSQNVIGTTVLTNWVRTDTGSYFIRVHKFVEPVDDEAGKPVNILNKVGKVPVVAVGNSFGDYAMLEYSKKASLSLQMIVNHDDSIREYYYDTEKMKKLCQDNKWKEISMRKDFRVVFKK